MRKKLASEKQEVRERGFSSPFPFPPPTVQGAMFHVADICPQLCFPRKLSPAILSHAVSGLLAAPPHLLVFLTLAAIDYTLSPWRTLIAERFLSLCSLETWVLADVYLFENKSHMEL